MLCSPRMNGNTRKRNKRYKDVTKRVVCEMALNFNNRITSCNLTVGILQECNILVLCLASTTGAPATKERRPPQQREHYYTAEGKSGLKNNLLLQAKTRLIRIQPKHLK